MIYKNYMKRIIDIIGSILMLLILWPLLIVIAIVIKIDSEGPAIFIQKRLTLNGKVFDMYKFRTMCVGAENIGSGAYSFGDDPRITRVGKILRKLSLDELLQLVNILKGDMSFIGPRPILTYHPCKYEEYTQKEKIIFTIRPGITGWAQVNGRNSVDWIKRFELNEWYVNNISFLLDIKIILMTIAQVFSRKEIIIQEETAKSFKNRKQNKKVDIKDLEKKGIEVLKKYGIKEEEAKIVIDSMISADKSGVSTHGIKMLCSYVNKLKKNEFSIQDIKILKTTNSFTTIDAQNTIGAISASKCVDIAIEKAKQNGIHFVFSKNSNTLGPAFYYVEKIAEKDMIGFLCCNSPATMPVSNGKEAMLGTNPLAFACPSKTQGTILVDMATSIVAKSKILVAKNNGEKIPEGWALDKEGISTTDPLEAIKGLLLPMAGNKGYCIALMIDIMSGMLSGAGFLNKVNKFYSTDGLPMNVGHLFIVIDPNQIYDGNFKNDMDNYIKIIRNSKTVKDKKITIPGDNKSLSRILVEKEGLYLSEETINSLNDLFDTEL